MCVKCEFQGPRAGRAARIQAGSGGRRRPLQGGTAARRRRLPTLPHPVPASSTLSALPDDGIRFTEQAPQER